MEKANSFLSNMKVLKNRVMCTMWLKNLCIFYQN